MTKQFAEMTATERRFDEVARRVCLPESQFKIFEYNLNGEERQLLESATASDIESMRQRMQEEGKAIQERDSDFDWLLGNGLRNIQRIAKFRKVCSARLYLDLAIELGFLHDGEHRHLMHVFAGAQLKSKGVFIHFNDNELIVDGKIVLKVRPTKTSKLDHILRSFEEVSWREQKIDFSRIYPYKENGGSEPSRAARDAANRLNNMQGRSPVIVFKATGTTIGWKLDQGL